jgi:hypothetical protein
VSDSGEDHLLVWTKVTLEKGGSGVLQRNLRRRACQVAHTHARALKHTCHMHVWTRASDMSQRVRSGGCIETARVCKERAAQAWHVSGGPRAVAADVPRGVREGTLGSTYASEDLEGL